MPQPPVRSDRLHPEARALLDRLDAEGAPPLETLAPAQARTLRAARSARLAGPPDPIARVEDLSVPGLGGDIPVRLYADDAPSPRPALVYLHGGGFVLGDLDTHDTLCRAIAKLSGALVLSVAYRLAPEHRFPAAVDDAHAVTLWAFNNADTLGIDPHLLSVGGDSAGGNLATVIALRCRDLGGPPIASQILLYPEADLSSLETPSHRDFAQGYGLTRAALDWFNAHYLASPAHARNPEASPLLAPVLANLPPALILTAEFDPLRDEAEAYAARLRQAGVAVTLTRYPGMIHGFMVMRADLSAAHEAVAEVARFLQPPPL
ncbi:MAG TPA: alpha/beta hydrolase [Acidobacteriaceae bacterium]|nr:alpha/beta hydrolase [Acidobacteriaceae bacterium]